MDALGGGVAVDWQAAQWEGRGWQALVGGGGGGIIAGGKTPPRLLLAVLLAASAPNSALTAYARAPAAAKARTVVGELRFETSAATGTDYYPQCGPPINAGFMIVLRENGQPVPSLRLGTFWLTVTDNCKNHNFELRSCPGSASPCDP